MDTLFHICAGLDVHKKNVVACVRTCPAQLKPDSYYSKIRSPHHAQKKTRRHFTPEQKAAIVRRHMVDKVPISDLCDEYGLQPSVLHGWHKQAADNLEAARARRKERRATTLAGVSATNPPTSASPSTP